MQIVHIKGDKRECTSAYLNPDYPGYIKVEYQRQSQTYIERYLIAQFEERNPKKTTK